MSLKVTGTEKKSMYSLLTLLKLCTKEASVIHNVCIFNSKINRLYSRVINSVITMSQFSCILVANIKESCYIKQKSHSI